MVTKDQILYEVTKNYLSTRTVNSPLSPEKIKEELLQRFHDRLDIENSALANNRKLPYPRELPPCVVAQILLHLYHFRRIIWAGTAKDGNCDLSLYQTDGYDRGIYVSDYAEMRNLIRLYNYSFSSREVDEVINILSDTAPVCRRSEDEDLIAVNNGIFDYRTKRLMDFTPDIVFTSKSHVDYRDNASNPVIHNDKDGTDWDVESWMNELSDDPEVIRLFWEIIGAIIRPNVPWDKVALLYSEKGNNGKGTFCELARQLCGEGTHASLRLSEFDKDFMLEPLTHVSAVITDENDVGTYIDKAANLKAILTGDAVTINRKFKQPITYQFKGFMIQCLNELPRIKDKSDSLYRRLLVIPFMKCFTGKERKEIKHDYLHRQDVLEYVLWKVLNMNFYELSVPAVCNDFLEEYKEFNDPIRQFAEEILPQCQWDLLPCGFLYALYKAWMKQNNSSGQVQGRNSFLKDLYGVVDGALWKEVTSAQPKTYMDKAEPLIDEYNLTDWMNPQYMLSKDIDKKCRPALKTTYNGLQRNEVSR